MIEYEYTEGNLGTVPIRVKIEGRIVGEIRPVLNGYRYYPKGQREGGETFNTITECQQSLDSEA